MRFLSLLGTLEQYTPAFFFSAKVINHMNTRKLILTIIKQVERIDPTLFVYGYQNANEPRTNIWWEISVSNFEFYVHNETFRKISNQWHNIAKSRGIRVVFVCGWKPTEERLVKLMNENNLILNIE